MTIYKGYNLDPQLVQVLERLERELVMPPLDQRSPELTRVLMEQRTSIYRKMGAQRKDNLEVHDHSLPGPVGEIPVRIYRPKGSEGKLPVLLYFHGGAWMRGNLDTHDDLAPPQATRLVIASWWVLYVRLLGLLQSSDGNLANCGLVALDEDRIQSRASVLEVSHRHP